MIVIMNVWVRERESEREREREQRKNKKAMISHIQSAQ